MPDPTRGFAEKSGLWPGWKLPTKPALRVLEHLMRSGLPEPRLFVGKRSGRSHASVSNAHDAAGFSIHIDLSGFFVEKWVEPDPEWTTRSAAGIKAYRITSQGREAVVQYYARERYLRENVELAKKIVAECRAALARR